MVSCAQPAHRPPAAENPAAGTTAASPTGTSAAEADAVPEQVRRALAPDGPSTTVSGRVTRVLGAAESFYPLNVLSREADTAVTEVSTVLPGRMPQPVLLVLPAGDDAFVRMTRTAASSHRRTGEPVGGVPAGTAAVAVASTDPDRAGSAARQWVVLNPTLWPQLSAPGRAAVLAHEFTHVAARDVTTERTPAWLVEGLADFVAYRRTAQPPSILAAELTARLRAGYRPSALPTSAQLSAEAAEAPRAYAEAWLACRYIADRWGVPALLRLYRLAGTAPLEGTTDVPGLFTSVLGTDAAGFTAGWAQYVEEQLR